MSSSKTEHRVPRTIEGDFLKIDVGPHGAVNVEQSKQPDLWSDREYRLLEQITNVGDVIWTVHHADPTLNGDTFALRTEEGAYLDISLLKPVKEITPGCLLNTWDIWDKEDSGGPGWQKMRTTLQKQMDRAITDEDVRTVARKCLQGGQYTPVHYSSLEIDVIHMDPTPDGPDEAEPADEIGPDTVFHATVKITYPHTLENHTIIEEIEDREPRDINNVLFRFDIRYPGAEPQVDIMMSDNDDEPGGMTP